jgi:sulfur relay (sulfurtransferase) complex TusBCD TusD component (DsrE family)
MNLWRFTAKIFPNLEKRLAEFVKKFSNPTLDEFHFPSAVDAATRNEECKVKVLKTSSKGRGITYPGDKIAMESFFHND